MNQKLKKTKNIFTEIFSISKTVLSTLTFRLKRAKIFFNFQKIFTFFKFLVCDFLEMERDPEYLQVLDELAEVEKEVEQVCFHKICFYIILDECGY